MLPLDPPALALATFAYLLGSVSFALLVARRSGIDLRSQGSGNVGATNVGRVVGKREGRVVLLLDALKGAVPTLLARAFLPVEAVALVGFAAVLGHCFPIWHGFRGGKGAATAAGVLLSAEPLAGAAAAVTYLGLKSATRRASVGSLTGALVGAAVTFGLRGHESPLTWMAVAIAVLVWVRHAGNLARLVRGAEPPS